MENIIVITTVHPVTLYMNDSTEKKLNIAVENLTHSILCRLEREYPDCGCVIF